MNQVRYASLNRAVTISSLVRSRRRSSHGSTHRDILKIRVNSDGSGSGSSSGSGSEIVMAVK